MGTSKGIDYTVEHILKSGRAFAQSVSIGDAVAIGNIATIKPADATEVLYVYDIFIYVNVEAATDWELQIKSPQGTFFTASASDTGIELASLIRNERQSYAGTTGRIYEGFVELKTLEPAYFATKSDRTVEATGGSGAWEVRAIGITGDGTDNLATVITFHGSMVKNKS